MTRVIFLTVALLGTIANSAALGTEVTLSANQILRIDFQMNGPFAQTPDVLFLGWEHEGPFIDNIGERHARLYHGNDLLGENVESDFGDYSAVVSLNPSNEWKSAGSVYNFASVTTVDFGDLFSGTGVGHVDFFIESGHMTFDSDNVTLIQVLATDFSAGTVITPLPTITSISIVPEPSCAVLVGIGAAAVFGLRRRRASEHFLFLDENDYWYEPRNHHHCE
jgi:hypothetical protein